MEVTYVARLSDGLVLCESWGSNALIQGYKQQARQVLRNINTATRGPTLCTVDCADNMCFHYFAKDGLIFMVMCRKSYNKKLAFIFLEELATEFQEELKLELGTHSTDYRSVIETIDKPYSFIKFDRVIQRRKAEFKDPRSSRALQKLNESLSEVTDVMRQNIDELMQRGENLASVSQKADHLKASSYQFAKATRMLNFYALLQKYAPFAFVGAILLLVIIFKFLI